MSWDFGFALKFTFLVKQAKFICSLSLFICCSIVAHLLYIAPNKVSYKENNIGSENTDVNIVTVWANIDNHSLKSS